MPKVTVINPLSQSSLKSLAPKKRVCAYCRVSSDSIGQLQSFSAQMEHYTALIEKNNEWQFCGVYADEGISGISKNKRGEFLRLIKDCEEQKIDMVITKSISRFARNTKDSIETIRKLKAVGVSVFFEKENIDTMSGESELVLTILSSIAQEESISISKNIRWGCQKRFQTGEWIQSYFPYGYTKDDNGDMIIEENESEVVRRIFREYLNGKGTYVIAKELTQDYIPLRRGGEIWADKTITDILQNERYVGDLLMQKTFTSDTFPFVRKRNTGQRKKYLVSENHEPIISRAQAEEVKEIMEYRKARLHIPSDGTNKYQNRYIFSGKIICGECGHIFKRQTISANKPYNYIQWCCGQHIRYIEKCGMKSIRDEAIKQAFVKLFNKLKCNYESILAPLLEGLKNISATDFNEAKIKECNNRINELTQQSHVLSRLRSKGYLDSALFIEKSNLISQELSDIKSKRNVFFNITVFELEIKRTEQFISILNTRGTFMEEFDENMFGLMVDKIIAKEQIEIIFKMANGLELTEFL